MAGMKPAMTFSLVSVMSKKLANFVEPEDLTKSRPKRSSRVSRN